MESTLSIYSIKTESILSFEHVPVNSSLDHQDVPPDQVLQKEELLARNVSNTSTLTSIVCVVAGSGVLGIPYAASQSGWIGVALLVLCACMAQFSGHLLIQCLYYKKSQRLNGFSDIGYASFGLPGRIVATLFSQLLLLFTPILYLVLAGQTVAELISIGNNQLTATGTDILSVFATTAWICLVLIVTVMSVKEAGQDIPKAHHDWVIPRNIPLAFSTISFAFCGSAVYPQLEASMEHPKSWTKVLMVATLMVTIMYLLVAFVCYLVFGDQVRNPIFDSLKERQVAMMVITAHVLLVIPMYLFVFTLGIETWVLNQSLGANTRVGMLLKRYPMMTRFVIRVSEMGLCGLMAVLVPYFADFMGLVGAMGELLTFVLPCAFWIKLAWKESDNPTRLGCLAVCLIGSVCAVIGAIDSISLLIN
ncbi:transmembrane amino acid transporter protein-domain-containing protein [Phycomyces nitens]|nr:transmembrane amino acid transporter protein-domain-containing protein [Phycomyces nitens]